jgi:hypothetical protein
MTRMLSTPRCSARELARIDTSPSLVASGIPVPMATAFGPKRIPIHPGHAVVNLAAHHVAVLEADVDDGRICSLNH